MTGQLLVVDGIDVFYGLTQILRDVGLSVDRGQSLALIGRNGAGKSTTLKSIIGLAASAKGVVRLGSIQIQGLRPDAIARSGIGYVPEDRQVFPNHTVEDNLIVAGKAGPEGQRDWTLDTVYDALPMLSGLRNRMAGFLSGGEQQMLTIARALMGNPKVMLLDEPSEGLAPIVVRQIGDLIRRLRDDGVTMIIAEQNMHFCLSIASHAAVIDRGQIVFRGTICELRSNEDVQRRYLAV